MPQGRDFFALPPPHADLPGKEEISQGMRSGIARLFRLPKKAVRTGTVQRQTGCRRESVLFHSLLPHFCKKGRFRFRESDGI